MNWSLNKYTGTYSRYDINEDETIYGIPNNGDTVTIRPGVSYNYFLKISKPKNNTKINRLKKDQPQRNSLNEYPLTLEELYQRYLKDINSIINNSQIGTNSSIVTWVSLQITDRSSQELENYVLIQGNTEKNER